MKIADAIVSDFHQEASLTRRVLEAVPEDKFDWKPHDKSMSLGTLVSHMAEMPQWVGAMLEPEMDFAELMDGYQPFAAKNGAELLAKFDENVTNFPKGLAGKDDEFMQETWTMRQGDQVLMKAPRHDAIRQTNVHHWVHHRGQLTVYLRLLGISVPPTYGPTADVQAFS